MFVVRKSMAIFKQSVKVLDMPPAPDPCFGCETSFVNGGIHKNVSIYKMGEYKITEKYSDDLQWEMHFGMGALKERKCFKKGQILFIRPSENVQPDTLKKRFHERLKLLPQWDDTGYFACDFTILECSPAR